MVENFRRVASSAMTEILSNEFIPSNSGTSSLSSENSEDSLHQSPDGRWQKINCGRSQPFLHTSASTRDALKNPWEQWFGCMCNQCPSASADSQECLGLRSTETHIAVEGIKSQGLTTCSHHLPASNLYTDQNFVDEECQNNSNKESPAKRLKTAF
ncbi:uncharacterized protein LOC111410808 isoform X2 [Olea europaea var. sylvestris]|uniref:uncharacterized protein LOC111410808 isoform X2 n=1 Tax=Olea europaea var. sylvestris TaxID=158386 RepID=UPI000C1CFF61|nr:uncharacterized protein LOC111410808 isoform X2 [Olea europaea var. sylvestris]